MMTDNEKSGGTERKRRRVKESPITFRDLSEEKKFEILKEIRYSPSVNTKE